MVDAVAPYSQSANFLVIYHNSIHPLANIVDGFLVGIGGGLTRTDLSVKVFKLLSETDVARNQAQLPPQSDAANFRRWEVAGSAHMDFALFDEFAQAYVRDIGPGTPPACEFPSFSRIPFRYVSYAAIDHLVRWVRTNAAPPVAPPIEVAQSRPAPPPLTLARDAYGNVLGGIRLPQHAVPTATNTGMNNGPGFCRLFGSHIPFGEATLGALYLNHGAYENQVARSAADNVAAGYMLDAEAAKTIKEAATGGVGK